MFNNKRIIESEYKLSFLREDITKLSYRVSDLSRIKDEQRNVISNIQKHVYYLEQKMEGFTLANQILLEKYERLLKHLQLEEVTYPEETVLREKPL